MSVTIGGRSANAGVSLIACIILCIIGAVFLLFGTFFLSGYGDKDSCTEQVTARVIRMEKRTSHSSGKHHRTSTTYAPVFEYEYNGKKYTYTSPIANNPPQFDAGEQVTIWVNPDSPNKIYYEPSGGAVFLTIVFRIMGGIALIGGIALLIFGIVKKPKTKSLDL